MWGCEKAAIFVYVHISVLTAVCRISLQNSDDCRVRIKNGGKATGQERFKICPPIATRRSMARKYSKMTRDVMTPS